ncbi:hypothetical protein Ancab_033362 [Ancistrocladus abbreviatus]
MWKSYDARYTSLVNVSKSLSSRNANEENVYKELSGLEDALVEQDAVIILNNMTNPETSLLALKHFQNKLKLKREVTLSHVALKGCRKHRDLERAGKLFEEMAERGVKRDNVAFSTIISCAGFCSLPYKAVQWFEKMPAYGYSADHVLYSALIDVYGQRGQGTWIEHYVCMIVRGQRSGVLMP